ncbi:MAG: MoxR family ATPase [Hominisplanchenecus sp.]|nr:MoxR family ATPase [Lachnospiraceae bacterium]MDY2819170.1 MoxR family ATPase [Hominisplanchenecus sp.]
MYLVNALNVIDEVKKAVIGKDACVERVMMAILAGGHILIEDIPGVGKTTMALAFSRACAMSQNRVQFTPDVLPADITGFSIYRKDTGRFEYQPGAVMCNLFLADEINRTSPKTQSALLEVMEEGNVTVDGVTRQVPRPFFVMATQNPIGSSGTQMLPESQLDRFMICISMGYPDIRNEIAILKDRSQGNPVDRIRPVIQVSDLLAMQEEVERIYIHDVLYNYIAELIALTRRHPMLELGVSPRGTIALTRMLKASAYLAGRNYVIPADVEKVFLTVNAHRVRLNSKARANHVTAEGVLEEILESIPKPSPKKK